jgi:hypothetical protein
MDGVLSKKTTNMKTKFSLFILAFIAMAGVSAAQQVLPFTAEGGSPRVTNDDDHRLFVYGIGSAESLQLDKLTATGSLSADLRLTDHFTCGLAFNYGSYPVKKEQADSVPLSVFYFPDISNTAFAASADYGLQLNDDDEQQHWLSFVAEASIQRRNIQKDTMNFDFGIVNFNSGIKYRWIYKPGEHSAIFTAGVFYNYIGINKNNTDAFNTLFNDYSGSPVIPVRHYFNGISMLASLQLDNAILFARAYTDFGKRNDLAFTVGIKAAATFFSF